MDLSSLQQMFSLEFTRLYLKMADSARQQCNYAVTTKYLKLTEAAITEVSVVQLGYSRILYYYDHHEVSSNYDTIIANKNTKYKKYQCDDA